MTNASEVEHSAPIREMNKFSWGTTRATQTVNTNPLHNHILSPRSSRTYTSAWPWWSATAPVRWWDTFGRSRSRASLAAKWSSSWRKTEWDSRKRRPMRQQPWPLATCCKAEENNIYNIYIYIYDICKPFPVRIFAQLYLHLLHLQIECNAAGNLIAPAHIANESGKDEQYRNEKHGHVEYTETICEFLRFAHWIAQRQD